MYKKKKKKEIKQAIEECSMEDPKRPENVESHMIHTLSYFVLNHETPHIMLPIMSFMCDITDLLDNYRNPKLDLLMKMKKDEVMNKAVVLLTEWANGGDLHAYIKKNMEKWFDSDQDEEIFSVILFQLIFTLLVIYEKYPKFRHNDLKVDNILVTEIRSGGYHLYHIDNKYYKLPNVGIQIKLWDFDFSCIKGFINNTKIKDMEEYGIRYMKNQYYDIHCFLNFLKIYTIGQKNYHMIPDTIQDFLVRYIPVQYRGSENSPYVYWGRVVPNYEHTTPLKILRNETKKYLFKQFVISKEEMNNTEFIEKFNI